MYKHQVILHKWDTFACVRNHQQLSSKKWAAKKFKPCVWDPAKLGWQATRRCQVSENWESRYRAWFLAITVCTVVAHKTVFPLALVAEAELSQLLPNVVVVRNPNSSSQGPRPKNCDACCCEKSCPHTFGWQFYLPVVFMSSSALGRGCSRSTRELLLSFFHNHGRWLRVLPS